MAETRPFLLIIFEPGNKAVVYLHNGALIRIDVLKWRATQYYVSRLYFHQKFVKCCCQLNVSFLDMLASTTEHSHGVILELLLKLLYPKGALKAIFIKKFEVSDRNG